MKYRLHLAATAILHFALCFPASASASVRFGLNDLSILLPLPKTPQEEATLLRTTSGPLISDSMLARLPDLINQDPDPKLRLSQLRVVGLRFDPCFAEGDAPVPCRRQIRLVFQPLSTYRGDPITFDAAVHAFYDFNQLQWNEIVSAWKQTAVGDPTEALQVHPLISRQGLNGAHWAKLREIVLKNCNVQNLTRVTSSSVNRPGNFWFFVGFNILADGTVEQIEVPGVKARAQAFIADLGNTQEFRG